MPFYDFACNKCKAEFNINASIKELTERSIPCPECASTDIYRVYKSINVITKPASGAAACPNSHVCGEQCCRH